ncbi:hypothetical protein NQ318_005283 [Aromia moschata]|uniref:Uncharacterized protein n=1 Tax=Aromia moschata TaxID=1265417 RepID=A0AAV8XPK6_9CUCU|nr:hypothetical protein NQ318_005283 [Aromia moschata]
MFPFSRDLLVAPLYRTTRFWRAAPPNHNEVPTRASRLKTNAQSSSTTTRVSKSSTTSTSTQRVHVTSDLKASNMKSDLVDFKNNLNDMKSSISNSIDLKKLRSSLENLVDADDEMNEISQPLVTFPDDTPVPSEIGSPTNPPGHPQVRAEDDEQLQEDQDKVMVVKDGFSAEKESAKSAGMKKLQTGDVSYEENSAAADDAGPPGTRRGVGGEEPSHRQGTCSAFYE